MKAKAKFNAMDFVIIVAVILVIAAAGLFFAKSTGFGTSSSDGESVKATIEVEFVNMEEYMTELPKVGDSVTIGAKEKMPATVTEVRSETAKTIAYDMNVGTAEWQEIPGKYDIYVTLEADAEDTGETIEINGSAIRVGDPNAVRSKGWAGYGYVTKVDVD